MAAPAAQLPSFVTRTPQVVNSFGAITISLPLINTGDETAEELTITSLSFAGGAVRIEPALPLLLGNIGADNVAIANGIFSTNNLIVGARYLATVRGTYRVSGATYGFNINRYIVVPAPSTPPIAFLQANLAVAIDLVSGTWSFTLSNEEAIGGHRLISALAIDINASFVVSGTPAGWAVETDQTSYVLWYVPAGSESSRVAPGSSLAGFQVLSGAQQSEGKPYLISSWNDQTNEADLIKLGTTSTPAGL